MTPSDKEFQEEFRNQFFDKVVNLRKEMKKKQAKLRRLYLWVELIFGLLGYGIIGYHNIWIAFGLFLATCGNNLGVMRNIYKDVSNPWKDAWQDKQ